MVNQKQIIKRITNLKNVNGENYKVVKSTNNDIIWLSINKENLIISKRIKKFYKTGLNKKVSFIDYEERKIKLNKNEFIQNAWIPLNEIQTKELIKVLVSKLKQIKTKRMLKK